MNYIEKFRIEHTSDKEFLLHTTINYISELPNNEYLINICWDYFYKIGVNGFIANANEVKWLLNNNFYSTEEINRIIEMKSFI